MIYGQSQTGSARCLSKFQSDSNGYFKKSAYICFTKETYSNFNQYF